MGVITCYNNVITIYITISPFFPLCLAQKKLLGHRFNMQPVHMGSCHWIELVRIPTPGSQHRGYTAASDLAVLGRFPDFCAHKI